jgi:hypothetical protein
MLNANTRVRKGQDRVRKFLALAMIIVVAFVMQAQPVAADPGGGFPCGSGCPQSNPTPTVNS